MQEARFLIIRYPEGDTFETRDHRHRGLADRTERESRLR
jgi:hypothetical protein